MTQSRLLQVLLTLTLFLVGVFATLSFEQLRYTKYLEPKMESIEPAILHEIISQQEPSDYLFLDVRTKGEYDKLHAKYSENQPIANLYDTWKSLPRDKDTKIYLICTGGRLSGVAYGFLQLHGFRNIVHVTGGVQNWSDSNLPTISEDLFSS